MIKFIQKYEKYFYIAITIVIVVSFSFFGTAGTIGSSNIHEQTAFTAVNGQKITRGELEELISFIQTDALDKRNATPYWGPNFLNDGVLRKDILESGIGEILALNYPVLIKQDLDTRALREKSFKAYSHPSAPFLSADMIWSYYAPAISQQLKIIKESNNPLDTEAFKARINLFLAEKEFPAGALTEVLYNQQSKYGWLNPDPSLLRQDLSLFGYHSMDDWFGSKFTRLMGEFIINSSILAEAKGYRVSKEEAWADLIKNSQASYEELSKSGQLPVNNENEYLREQLRRMGMDRSKASGVWQKVLLFRRLFHDIANSTLIEPKTLQLPNAWVSETATGDLYRMPKALRFSDLMDLAEFEIYEQLTANNDSLLPPQKALAIEEVMKRAPELVGKRYLVTEKSVNLKDFESRVSLKETLRWQSNEENFSLLKKEFADLGTKDTTTLEKRVDAIDSLSDVMRNKVDAFVRTKIALSHPEWIEQALSQQKSDVKTITVFSKSDKSALPGVKDNSALIKTLDQAALNKEISIVGDPITYRLTVIDRSSGFEIATFEEAKSNGSLSSLTTKELEAFYPKVRDHNTKFKKESGGFKPLAEVKSQVAELWLESKLTDIQKAATAALKDKAPKSLIPDLAATLRFTAYADKVKQAVQNGLDTDNFIAAEIVLEPESDKLKAIQNYQDQFKWLKIEKKVSRGNPVNGNAQEDALYKDNLLSLKQGEWSTILTPSNGDISFFKLASRRAEVSPVLMNLQIHALREVLGSEAEREYATKVIALLKEKGAMSFDYLDRSQEEIEPLYQDASDV